MGYYSRTPLIRTLVIRIANYPNQLGHSDKHLRVQLCYTFYGLHFSPICQTHVRNYVLMFYSYVNKYVT